MKSPDLQKLCESGQQRLVRGEYLEAERLLAEAEQHAWNQRDFDTLSRLYLPLQEARRQRRQRCAEGVVRLDLVAEGPTDRLEAQHVVENYPHGQLLVAGWGSIEPARQVRQLQRQFGLYVETFLAAIYPTDEGRVIVVTPLDEEPMPDARPRPLRKLESKLPAHCLILRPEELPAGSSRGNDAAMAAAMRMWARLHEPFLAIAEGEIEPLGKIEGWMRTIAVDYGCELAHQHLAELAREMARRHGQEYSRPSPEPSES